MISRYNGDGTKTKLTPKQYAAEFISNKLDNFYYWNESSDASEMTERERELVSKFIEQITERFRRQLAGLVKA